LLQRLLAYEDEEEMLFHTCGIARLLCLWLLCCVSRSENLFGNSEVCHLRITAKSSPKNVLRGLGDVRSEVSADGCLRRTTSSVQLKLPRFLVVLIRETFALLLVWFEDEQFCYMAMEYFVDGDEHWYARLRGPEVLQMDDISATN